jgi:subtilisin family serine protease
MSGLSIASGLPAACRCQRRAVHVVSSAKTLPRSLANVLGGTNMKRILSLLLLAIAMAGLFATGAAAAVDTSRQWVPGELIVKFKPGVSSAQKALLVQGQKVQDFTFIGAEHWKIGDASVVQAVAALEANPNVEYAEPNYLQYALETPNDPLFGQLWGMNNTGQTPPGGGTAGTPDADIDAVEAWDVFTGSSSVVVAVIDTGVDYTHPDLAANAWANPGEIPGNGIDDDGNGFIDDVRGWDFANGDNNPMDDNGHGTHCSGTIGGTGNNGVGVAGVNWNVKIMGLKFLTSGGSGSTANAISCIQYATMMGVDVMSNSWGGGGFSQALLDAIVAANAADIYFVAAAGNSGSNNDVTANYPSNYDSPNVIAVMATNNRDQRVVEPGWWSSSYGATTVDIAAPGLYIVSTVPGGYDNYSGTSMATPHVAGAMAMLRGRFPNISVADGKSLLLNIGNDPIPALSGLCVTGGRLNLLRLIGDPDETPPSAVIDLAVGNAASNWLQLTWTAPGDDDIVGTASSYDVRYAAAPIVDQAGWDAATQATGEPDPGVYGTPETMQVGGLVADTTYYFSIRAKDEYGNLGGLSNSPAGTTLPPPTVAVNPGSLSANLSTGGTETQTLTVTNAGLGVLDFTIPTPSFYIPAKAAGQPVPRHEYVELAKGETDLRAGINGSGGPDAFGYSWSDSDEPGGPAFNWIDISALGTAVTLTDDSNQGPFNLGFDFPFYGTDFSTFRICSNGWVSFSSTSTSLSNVALPATGAPFNLLALFWDDLIPATGSCRYHYDGTRMIIQYTGWGNYSGAGTYTMQMHLYPNGTVEYHYLTLTGPLNSGTVGIQNADGTDGLTVAFNAAYLHDNLAIRFASLPQWLTVSPNSGSLAAGASLDIDVTFDGTGLCGSQFLADIHVLSNDPLNPDVTVPATINLTGTPDILLATTGLNFGPVYITGTATQDVGITNGGCADLTISSLSFDNTAFTTTLATPVVLFAGASVNVPVTFAPTSAGTINGNLTIGSDDPDSPSLVVTLTGVGLDFPNIAVTPASLTETLPTGGTSTQQLTITNNGLGDLNFTIPEAEYITVVNKSAQPKPGSLPIDLAKDATDPRLGTPVVNGAGGPDAYGYKWKDSDEVGGPAYNWIEISGIGTEIPFTGDDQNLGAFNIGFNFPFYGTDFSSFRACSNGWISFTNLSTTYTNYDLPSASAPENLIAPFWDDLTFTSSGDAYYYNDGQRLIIEYKNVPRLGSGGPYSFQVHLYPSGRIEFHYQSMQGTRLNEATIGIQNETKDAGLAPAFNVNYVHDNLAIRFEAQTPWLSATPNAGTVAPGQSAIVTVGFDAADLCGDSYSANLHVLSNDPDSPDVTVPVTLNLLGAPDAQVAPATLAFGDVYLTQSNVLAAAVANVGCASLQVTGISIDNPVFTADVTDPFAVAPGATQAINVTFTPDAVGPATGTLTLTTNDVSHPVLVVALTGNGLANAGIVVTPASIAVTVPSSQQRTATIHIENTGAGDLSYTVPSPELYNKVIAHAKAAAPAVERPKDAADEEFGISPLGSGGPDAYGYSWKDSDEVGGPTFNWIEISGTGTAAMTTGDDSNAGPFPIGFAFDYYGTDFTTFRVCSNGWLSFTSTLTSYTNTAIPSASAPLNMLAPFWDDLNLSAAGSGDIYYQNVGGNLVVQYNNVMRYGTTTPVTFQVILTPSGHITYQYLNLSTALTNSCTVGMQNATGTVGLQVVYNAAYLHNNLAIKFQAMPEWATVSPTSGTIPAGGSVDLTVTMDATGMELGLHTGMVRILSNDLNSPEVQVPLSMMVQDYTSGVEDLLPARLVLSQNVPNPFNPATKISFALPTRGQVDLRVFDVRGALVRTLATGELEAGFHDFMWTGMSDAGVQVPSGVYFYRLRTAEGDITRSMTLLK